MEGGGPRGDGFIYGEIGSRVFLPRCFLHAPFEERERKRKGEGRGRHEYIFRASERV